MAVNLRGLSPRDKNVLDDLGSKRVLDIWQIYRLHFPSIYTAQRRMAKLAKDYKRANRLRLMDGSYAYYLDSKPQQVDHFLGINDFYVWLTTTLPADKKLTHWENPDSADKARVRPDAIYAIHTENKFRNEDKWFCLEYETGSNTMTKIRDYNEFYKNGEFKSLWWANVVTGFPAVVIVTEGSTEYVRQKIECENECKLEFQVISATRIRKEIGRK